MRRILRLLLALVVVDLIVVLFSALPSDQIGPAYLIGAAVIIVVVHLSLLFFRSGSTLSPVMVYLSLIAGVGLAIGGVLSLSMLGLTAVILLTAAACVIIVLTTLRQIRIRKSRARADGGFCSRCGYDLRQSFERCPECGGPIPVELARRRRIAARAAARAGAETGVSVEVTPPPLEIIPDNSTPPHG